MALGIGTVESVYANICPLLIADDLKVVPKPVDRNKPISSSSGPPTIDRSRFIPSASQVDWAVHYVGKYILAKGDKVYGQGHSIDDAWVDAREKMSRDGLACKDLVPLKF